MRPRPIHKTALLAWAVALVFATPSGLTSSADFPPKDPAPTLTVLFSGDTRGVLEPCECRGGMRGGLARRATVLKGKEAEGRGRKGEEGEGRKAEGWLIVDNGNLLGRDVDALRVPVLVQSLQRMGYAVLHVAPEDAQGEGFLTAARAAGLRLVSLSASGEGVQPSLVTRVNDVRVGLSGVAPPLDRQTVARVQQHVASLRPEVDLLILLSRLGLKEDVRLARQVRGIDLIISANGEGAPPPLKRVGSTWIASTGTRGEYVGEVTFRVSEKALGGSPSAGGRRQGSHPFTPSPLHPFKL